MLSIKGLKKSYWAKIIFDDASLKLNNKIKSWLVWINGVWKSTLFKVISWLDQEYEWEIVHDNKTPLIWYMEQEIDMNNFDCTLIEFLRRYAWIEKVENLINYLLDKLEDTNNLESYWEQYELFERMWWYEFESKAHTILSSIGLWKYESSEVKVKQLSGGERNKLLLCGSILKWGDLLLLDEPTNNLDKKSIEWLINVLKESLASCLIISHDKYFLNAVVNKIFELNEWKFIEYSWDYKFYEREKKIQYENQFAEHERQQEEFKRMETSKKNLQDKARTIGEKWNTRDNDKWDWSSKVAKKLASQASSIKSRIKKTETIEKPKTVKEIEFKLTPEETPDWNITITDVSYSYPENPKFQLAIEGITINGKDKIYISWENGHWKSTFVKLLQWEIKPTSWNIHISQHIKIGVFSQDHGNLPGQLTPIDYIESKWTFPIEEVIYTLAKLWFEKDDREKQIMFLSPWMRARLVFSLLSLQHANCVIFDEPTNHIDIHTIKELEKAINWFNWMIFVVSHDSEFINNINFTKQISFKSWIGTEKLL